MSAVLWGALVAWLGVGIAAVPAWSRRSSASRCSRSSTTWSTTGCCARRSASASGSATSGSTPRTRWNSNNIATNVLLYHLQRHSDHHANPTRRYQSLRDFEESPVLPTGYAGMIVLAIVPAVWRRVMDPRVLAHFDGDLAGPTSARASGTGSSRSTRRPVASGDRGSRRLDRRRGRRTAGRRGPGRALPRLRLHLRGRGRRRARGLRGRHGLGRHPRRLVLPRLRGAREGRLRPARIARASAGGLLD